MSANIIPTTAKPLLRLLQVFDAESLGEGDLVAGANVLAAMCASIANVHPPGTCLVTTDGKRLLVGMSFITAGGLTNSLVGEKVLDPIAHIQNNLSDHLAADAAHSAQRLAAMAPHELARIRPKEPEDKSLIKKLAFDLDPDGISPARDSSPFQRLLEPSRHQGLGELAATPAVFLSADSPEGLEKQLSQAHRRFPYVRAFLASGSGTDRLESVLLSVVRGAGLPGGSTGSVHIRGQVAASCTPAKLAQLAAAGEDSLAASLMWLVDGDGADLAMPGDPTVPYAMQRRYHEALHHAWRPRLDHRFEPGAVRFDWPRLQSEWVAFLRKHEASSPGVTLSARPLLATLLFGCVHLHDPTKSTNWSAAGVVELAQFMVDRMVRCRAQLMQAGEDAQDLELAIKLISKLEDGPLDARGIVRKTSRLRIADCRKVLELYDRLGVARRVGADKWELALPVAQAVRRIRAPYIDV